MRSAECPQRGERARPGSYIHSVTAPWWQSRRQPRNPRRIKVRSSALLRNCVHVSLRMRLEEGGRNKRLGGGCVCVALSHAAITPDLCEGRPGKVEPSKAVSHVMRLHIAPCMEQGPPFLDCEPSGCLTRACAHESQLQSDCSAGRSVGFQHPRVCVPARLLCEERSTAARAGVANHLGLSGHDSLTSANSDGFFSPVLRWNLCFAFCFGKASENPSRKPGCFFSVYCTMSLY